MVSIEQVTCWDLFLSFVGKFIGKKGLDSHFMIMLSDFIYIKYLSILQVSPELRAIALLLNTIEPDFSPNRPLF